MSNAAKTLDRVTQRIGRLGSEAPEVTLGADESARIRDVGIDREGLACDEVGIGGHGELDFTVDVIRVAKRDAPQVRSTIA